MRAVQPQNHRGGLITKIALRRISGSMGRKWVRELGHFLISLAAKRCPHSGVGAIAALLKMELRFWIELFRPAFI
jgi:hypothetical protein